MLHSCTYMATVDVKGLCCQNGALPGQVGPIGLEHFHHTARVIKQEAKLSLG